MSEISAIGLAQLAGDTITVGGITYRLAPLSVTALGELESWVMTKLPDPIQVAREITRDLPSDLARDILLEAYSDVKNGARRLGSSEANKALATFEGYREMLFQMGRTHHPHMGREDWERVLTTAIAEDAEALAAKFNEANGGAILDPKARSSSETAGVPPIGATSTSGLPNAGTGTGNGSIG